LLSASATNGLGGSQNPTFPNSTADQALVLGDLSIDPQAQASGNIGNGPAGAADVEWYSFTLDGPATVNLDLHPQGSSHPLDGVLSLYADDPFDFGDPYDSNGYRLMVQAAGSNGADPQIDRSLSPGTYSIAVSGAGNLYFNPLLAGSGFAGATGDYNLTASATALHFGPNDGPAVLTSDPAANAVLDASPFAIRLDFSSALDPASVIAGQTVTLTYNPSGNFGDGSDQSVALASTNVSSNGTELQLFPNAPLAPGYYEVFVAGNSNANPAVVADLNGNSLGSNSANPQGEDFTETFQVAGIKGQTGPMAGSDDTPSTAQDLGNITTAGLIQVVGAIGDDPYYDNSDPAHNPANDVDLYHFQITGSGRYALEAEVFAGRIGSPLDPGMSLYGVDPATGVLQFIAGNNNTNDGAQATDGSFPLSFDSALSQGLPAGNYYLAVADGFNVTSPAENQPVGGFGQLDPTTTHSAQNGYTVGPYVLNLLVQAVPGQPVVIATSPAQGAILSQAPTQLTVQFSQAMNIQQQAYLNYEATNFCSIPSVYIQGSDGTDYYPRLDSYDPQTNQATLLMLDRLAPGSYTLHLSGALGLANLGGTPLVGNTPSSDYLVQFTVKGTDLVQGSDSGEGGQIQAQPGPDGFQNLGPLFPIELQSTVTLAYTPAVASATSIPPGTEPTYEFNLLIDQYYLITLDGSPLPQGASLQIQSLTGQFVTVLTQNAGRAWFGEFEPGSYKINVQGMTPDTPYQITFLLEGTNGNPVPLVSGAAPALQFHFDTLAPLSTVAVTPTAGGGDGTTSNPPGKTGGDSTLGGGGTSNPPSTSSDGPSPSGGSVSGSSNTPAPTTSTPSPAPAGGGGGTGVLSSPVPFSANGPSGSTVTPTGDATAQAPLLVTLNVPTENVGVTPGSPETGPVAGTGGGAGAVLNIATSTAVVGVGLQVVNLVSANLALLGVGPIGGVSQTSTNVSGIQSVQVALPTPGNSPIPSALVSLVTLTRSGELGDLLAPAAPPGAKPEPGQALVETPALASRTEPSRAGPIQQEAEAPRKSDQPRQGSLFTVAGVDTPDASRPAAAEMIAPAASALAGKIGEPQSGVERSADDTADSLASANGPWLLLITVLGSVALYARRRRLARRAAAARRFVTPVRPTPGLFRLWGLRQPARKDLPHAMRSGRPSLPSNPFPRPRHLSNP
jgi:methionine-rich copper-binding protein CopC